MVPHLKFFWSGYDRRVVSSLNTRWMTDHRSGSPVRPLRLGTFQRCVAELAMSAHRGKADLAIMSADFRN